MFVLQLALGLSGCARLNQPVRSMPYTAIELRRFDQTREIACHNCYDPATYSGRLKQATRQVRSIELDFWPQRSGGWRVRHHSDEGGNNCGNTGTDGLDLAGCLHVLAKVLDSDASPGQPIPALTVFLDLKAALAGPGEMARLDSMVTAVFGSRLLRPRELIVEQQKSVAAAVAAAGWPSHGALRGRVILVLTGGVDGPMGASPFGNPALGAYVQARGSEAALFVAPSLVNPLDVKRIPKVLPEVRKWVVFGNMPFGDGLLDLNDAVRAQHWIGRVWGGDSRSCRYLKGKVARIARLEFQKKVSCPTAQPDNWRSASSIPHFSR